MSATAQDMQPIEQRMSPEARKESGLDKLTPAELGALNAWIESNMSEKAIRKSLIGFPVMHLFAGGEEAKPIVAHLDGEFRGWKGSTKFTLDNGQVWEQIEPGSLIARRVNNPAVTIKPAMMGTWMLQVDGYNRSVRVQRIK
ncbi:MAG: hypothetical protein ABIP49_10370 [Lysobacterales bacterium]